ncbi:MAG: Gfo/Idh/MocA family oxidoreductase [Ktedonobacteraceae bacterium]|nr:Gfo/Idh/MocA family oxidoreductase [Ktedonobacteraceae bacterium]MBO0795975.1 Gfo/Idh/MocA family oxidoreductase [Ktedonobacteraceae bacterium]
MKRIKVGVIGLGEVAQIIHLPILEALSERYEVTALCDISRQLLEHMGKRYNVDKLYTNYHQMVAQADIDVVFVLNSDEYHADATIAALRQGKHVLVEKPMCLNQADADAIIRARDEAGTQVMVAYMRRYAPAFVEGVQQVRQLEKINFVRIRDIIGANRLMIEQSSNVLYPQDIPATAIQDRQARARTQVVAALGEQPRELMALYRFLCGLGSHDLSAMREMIGGPRRVLAAAQWNGGRFLSAILEYDTYCANVEIGTDSQRRFDAHIEVYGDKKTIRVQYDTPYIRHLPTTLHIGETRGDAHSIWVVRPTYIDPYTHELLYLYNLLVEGGQPKTTPEDFQYDLRLFSEIVDVIRKKS